MNHPGNDYFSHLLYDVIVETDIQDNHYLHPPMPPLIPQPLPYQAPTTSSQNITTAKPTPPINTNVEKPFKCEKCEYRAAKKHLIRSHQRVHATVKPWKCDLCDYAATHNAQLKKHKRTHSVTKPYKCSLCSYTSKWEWGLKKHSVLHTGIKAFKCTKCDYTAVQMGNLKRHLRVHTEERILHCEACEFTTRFRYEMKAHKLSHLGKQVFLCDECGHVNATLSGLRRHKILHSGVRPFHCIHCKYSATKIGNLQRHLKMHNEKVPYLCTVCGYSSTENIAVNRHKRIHPPPETETVRPVYQCSDCDYQTKFKSVFKLHRIKHTGEQPYKCTHTGCNYVSTKRSNFARHQTIHSSTKSLACEYEDCDFTTNLKYALKLHFMKHTGMKPFCCPYCDYTSCRNANLQRHLKVHYNPKFSKHKPVDPDKDPNASDHDQPSDHDIDPMDNQDDFRADFNNDDDENQGEQLADSDDGLHYETVVNLDSDHDESGTKAFACNYANCNFSTNRINKLKLHGLTHSGAVLYKCSFCKYISTRKDNIRRHQKKHPMKLLNSRSRKKKSADSASKPNDTSENADQLDISSLDPKKFNCDHDDCNFGCNKINEMKLHKKIHAGTPLLKCDQCGYSTPKNANLVRHQKIHSSGRGSSSQNDQNEDDDQNNDTGDSSDGSVSATKRKGAGKRKYVTKSKKSTKQKQGFTVDMKQLDNISVKVFNCTLCKYSTKSSAFLFRHQKVHVNSAGKKAKKAKPARKKVNNESSLSSGDQSDHSRDSTKDDDYAVDADSDEEYSNGNDAVPEDISDESVVDQEDTSRTKKETKATPTKRRAKSKSGNPYKCTDCDYSSPRKSNFVRHQKIHSIDGKMKRRKPNRAHVSGNSDQNIDSGDGAANEDGVAYEDGTKNADDNDAEHPDVENTELGEEENSGKTTVRRATKRKANSTPRRGRKRKRIILTPDSTVGDDEEMIGDDDASNDRQGKVDYNSDHQNADDLQEADKTYSGSADKSKRKGGFKFRKTAYNQARLFKCTYCNYSSARNSNLLRHVKIHSKPRGRKRRKIAKNTNAEVESDVSDGLRRYQCSHCDYATEKKANLTRHEKVHSMGEAESPKKKWLQLGDTSEIADQNSSDNSSDPTANSAYHSDRDSGDDGPSNQEEDQGATKTVQLTGKPDSSKWKPRWKRFASGETSTVIDLNPSCDQTDTIQQASQEDIGEGSNDQDNVDDHVDDSNTKIFRCDYVQCKYVTKRKYELKLHKMAHVGAMRYQCSYCSYGTMKSTNMRRHEKVHLSGKSEPTKWRRMNISASTSSELQNVFENTSQYGEAAIQEDEVGAKYYKCEEDQCQYYTKRKYELKMHKMAHFGAMRYQCSYCDYATNKSTNLRRHEQVHSTGRSESNKWRRIDPGESSSVDPNAPDQGNMPLYASEQADILLCSVDPNDVGDFSDSMDSASDQDDQYGNRERFHNLSESDEPGSGTVVFQCSECKYTLVINKIIAQQFEQFQCNRCSNDTPWITVPEVQQIIGCTKSPIEFGERDREKPYGVIRIMTINRKNPYNKIV